MADDRSRARVPRHAARAEGQARGVARRAGTESIVDRASSSDPEQEIVLADSVGVALLVVLETLTPAERLAFVLHDISVHRSTRSRRLSADRSPRRSSLRAARGVAYTARAASPTPKLGKQRELVEAFLAASRSGDFDALVAALDPDATVRADTVVVRGASLVAKQAFAYSRANVRGSVRVVRVALVNGAGVSSSQRRAA